MFSEIFPRRGGTFVPGCYDALTARLVETAGFPAAYIGGSAIAAASLCLPDTGVVTLDDIIRAVKSAASAIRVPLVADADHAFFDAANVWRAIHAFEDAGAFAIHIEDHAGGKHTELGNRLTPLPEIVAKLRAAIEARRGGLSIIARTDAIWTGHGLTEAVERLKAFAEIGVDAVFPTFATPDMVREIGEAIDVPIMVIDRAGSSTIPQWRGIADLVVDYGYCSCITTKALSQALGQAHEDPGQPHLAELGDSSAEFEARLGYAEYIARFNRYQ